MPTELDHVGPTGDCPHPELWTARDAAASEVEVGDFLYGLIRILKPSVVVETGCYLGDTTEAIGKALKANGCGFLYSCDTMTKYVVEAMMRVRSLPVVIDNIEGSLLVNRVSDVDLAFIDSGGDRLDEAKALKLSKHGIIVLHDSRHESVKGFGEQLGMVEIFIPTPRGISIFKRSL